MVIKDFDNLVIMSERLKIEMLDKVGELIKGTSSEPKISSLPEPL